MTLPTPSCCPCPHEGPPQPSSLHLLPQCASMPTSASSTLPSTSARWLWRMLSEYRLLRDMVKGFEDLRGALEVSCPSAAPVECPGGMSREIEPLSLMAPWGMSPPASSEP